MKYTIEGFSQEYAASLVKEVTEKRGDKIINKTIRIDCTDLVILRWFVDFFPNMRKMHIEGKEYALLVHSKLQEDLPILGISRKACIERMQKLVSFGILDYQIIKEGGTYSFYGFGENYIHLIKGVYGQTGTGCTVEPPRGVRSNGYGVYGQTDNKDNSISNTSINNTSIKNTNKAASGIDTVLAQWVNNNVPESSRDSILDLLREWVSIRKEKRAPSTVRAIELNLEKLIPCASSSNMTVSKYLEEVICRGWQAFYEIPNMNGGQSNGKYARPTGGDTDYSRGEETLGTML